MQDETRFNLYTIHSEKEFKEVFKKCFETGDNRGEPIENHLHYKYFFRYLYTEKEDMRAQTILCENKYLSTSYRGDYLNYYARANFDYSRWCKRVHFFSANIEEVTFLKMITQKKEDHEDLWESYLGYIVVRPLPKGIIGATLLKTYRERPPLRKFTVIRKYPVNIFGTQLSVETLAYQEQDGVVGSCASSALWCAFQHTSGLFSTPILHPSDISLKAGLDIYKTGKTFPSVGLQAEQICNAIQANGLIAEFRNSLVIVNDTNFVKSILHAYLRMGIPVMLGIDVENRGRHLITLAGFRFYDKASELEAPPPVKAQNDNTLTLKSDDIIKLYAHDDQIGPFSRLTFLYDDKDWTFSTSIWRDVNSDETLKARLVNIIAPINKDISVSFDNMHSQVVKVAASLKVRIRLEFKWDIFLVKSNVYKEEIKKELENADIDYTNLLFQCLPEYIWVVKAYTVDPDILAFDLLYDVADINFQTPFVFNLYNDSFNDLIKALGKNFSDLIQPVPPTLVDLVES